MENVISKTGQAWKIKALNVSTVLAIASIIYGQANIETLSTDSFGLFFVGGVVVGLFSFLFACISIKCPNCGKKWFWSAVSGKDKNGWWFWLNSLESCPKCGEPKGK
jgi:hypothetical protein